MERTTNRSDYESMLRFADIYMSLSEENKKLVFAFAQGMETQRLIAQKDKLTATHAGA